MSQTGALKQRKIVRRLKHSIKLVQDSKYHDSFTKYKNQEMHKQVNKSELNDFDSMNNAANDFENIGEDFFPLYKKQKLNRLDDNDSNGKINRGEHVIGEGGFGKVYHATDSSTKQKFAMKVESVSLVSNPRLIYEYKIYKILENVDGFPKAYEYCSHDLENRLVVDLLGQSLEKTFQDAGQKFTLHDILIIAVQLINRIESFHEKGFVHRDIKPANILFGRKEDKSKLFLIDFGLAKMYQKDGEHIKMKEGKQLLGTPRYCCINAASGMEQSRRDDLESLGYVLAYFLRKNEGLPWQKLKTKEKLTAKETFERVLEVKKQTKIEDLFKNRQRFINYMEYVRNLDFTATPDYSRMRSFFEDGETNDCFEFDVVKDEMQYRNWGLNSLRRFINYDDRNHDMNDNPASPQLSESGSTMSIDNSIVTDQTLYNRIAQTVNSKIAKTVNSRFARESGKLNPDDEWANFLLKKLSNGDAKHSVKKFLKLNVS